MAPGAAPRKTGFVGAGAPGVAPGAAPRKNRIRRRGSAGRGTGRRPPKKPDSSARARRAWPRQRIRGAGVPGVAPSTGLFADDRGNPPRASRAAWPRAADWRSGHAGRGPEKTGFIGAGAPGVAPCADPRKNMLKLAEILRGLPGRGPEHTDCSQMLAEILRGLPGRRPQQQTVC